MDAFLGLDVGGTKIEIALITRSEQKTNHFLNNTYFKIIDRMRIPTQREQGYQFVLQNISKICQSITQKNNMVIENIQGIGLGLPGSIDPSSQMMLNGNSNIFKDKNIINDLKKLLKIEIPIFIENDANLFALSETLWGVGVQHQKKFNIKIQNQISIGIILGTGCGGGIIINKEIFRGRRGSGAEVGHSCLIENGYHCYCGKRGCAEQYLSGSGLTLDYQTLYNKTFSAKDIFEQFEKNNSNAIIIVNRYINHLELFLSNLVNIIDPDYVVLGGGVSNQNILYQSLTEKIQSLAFLPNTNIQIYKNTLGDSAGVIGAALLPILKHKNIK